MKETSFWMTMEDRTEVYVKKWQSANPRLIVQISHGMVEHIHRYQEFAEFLAKNNITVYGNDHRGHGRTGEKQGHPAHLADKNGFEKTTDDLYQLNKLIHEENPGTPVILFGHSMGSFLARRYIQLHGNSITGLVISGTAAHPGLPGKIAAALAKLEEKRIGRRTPSSKLNKLVFGPYANSIANPQTKFDWLTRDGIQVRKYLEDPLTGMVPTAGFFLDLFHGLDLIHKKSNREKVPKQLPILFIAGTNDPVGNKAAGVLHVMKNYYQAGVENITGHFYEEGRHEMLNELNKETVYEDVLEWLETVIMQRIDTEADKEAAGFND